MASRKQLASLFRAIANENIPDCFEAAEEICKSEDARGHRTAARLLRQSLSVPDAEIRNERMRPVIQNGSMSFPTGVTPIPTTVDFSQISLSPDIRDELNTLVAEWHQQDRLRQHGLSRRTKIILHGPPGCGKSLTARALAKEFGLPLYLVRFDAVIAAYLGQTAVQLRQLFHFAETTPSILLFDEIDALGKSRGRPSDVGELDRITIALMQELEHARPMGLLIATSNLAKDLDEALWRRFDLDVLFKPPTQKSLRDFSYALSKKLTIEPSKQTLIKAAKAKSYASAEAIIVAEARKYALKGD